MMHALKHPSFFKPTSRPSSPAPAPPSRPDSGIGFDRTPRPLHKLSLSTFRKASPAPVAPKSPTKPPSTLVQDGSYLEMLSLKLSEAVSKALAQPLGPAVPMELVGGKRPIPAGRGRALGALITSELRASHDNQHLYRASLRGLHRPLSVLVSNLSAQLVPLVASPAFLNFLAPSLNATQLHAMAIAAFAGELLDCFDESGLGLDSDPHGLKTIREGLVSVVNRVINPLIVSIKNDLGAVIDGLEFPQTPIKTIAKPSVSHPSLVALQGVVPAYTRILERCISLPGSQTTVATFLISLIWRGLVALSHRPYHPPSPPASPYLAAHDVKKRRGSSTTPPLTPPSSRFTIKLPPSRPPSPPSRITSSTSTDARALYEILSHLPRPAADKEASRLAREAVEEAFTALHAFDPFIEAVYASTVSPMSTVVAERLVTLAKELPTLIVLQVILNAYGSPLGTSLPQILRLDTAEYKQVCLSGFGRAEECGPVLGQHALDALRAADPTSFAVKWLELELAAEPETAANATTFIS
ncbi:hypothetical protein BDN71DRAFT_1388014 [Pleurotus eryngii]|uniref:Uncharacterized protein n=1 Tax=Pleurotus eryngii TaxID=5323 RepID=A0A9P6A095_PLEER|nr:hypothetical protein BDN71DRAFT_1388014 [Pleurotus eryngii]